ncbi:PucR family transcriptional regulator [Burkholderia diffusa]|uniref:PucR family transcriptional regulator n=1 Tax=Burkholderia diffusa TaxID=488732 RepID=UPI00157A6A83|nr:PucR family transcriptional regulator [Burkholderia diffusa]NTY38060.1 PucR family transcriptional regulator [Burkholderia diffusa]
MKLQTAIRETVLREATVVAGEHSLDREITWVHMVDHPEIADWVKPGELLLTTGYNWPRDEVASRQLVRKLSEIGLAGVVLAVPNFLEHFPMETVDEANHFGVPLLELPWEVQFSEVTHEILAQIINFQAEIIERSERLHRALTNATVSAMSLSDIALALSNLLARTVTFSDVTGHILGSSASAADLASIEQQLVDAVHNDTKPPQLADMHRPTPVEFQLPDAPLSRLCLPVRLQDSIVSLIWLDITGDGIHELDSRAIEHASVVAALHLMHQRQLTQQEERLGYALVAGLLDGEFNATATALERAKVCGWSDSKHYRVCLVLLDEPIPLTPDGLARRERWTDSLKRELRARGLPVLLGIWLNQVKFIVPANAPLDALWTAVSDRHAAMAVSRVHVGVRGMAVGSQDVDALVPTLRPGRMHQFDEILFPRALMGDSDARDMLIARLVKPLTEKRRGDSLLETLGSLADEGFQLANTSKALGIHISTLRYRLERIEDILSVSLEDPHVRFEVQVAIALYRLLND